MDFDFDPQKDARNRILHGVSLTFAMALEWETALVWPDLRRDYGELRQCALAYLEDRLYFVAFTDRVSEVRRIISLRKANRRELKRYVQYTED
jgi:uncharacterized DUF497 family protein